MSRLTYLRSQQLDEEVPRSLLAWIGKVLISSSFTGALVSASRSNHVYLLMSSPLSTNEFGCLRLASEMLLSDRAQAVLVRISLLPLKTYVANDRVHL